jgi:hypothetical protein
MSAVSDSKSPVVPKNIKIYFEQKVQVASNILLNAKPLNLRTSSVGRPIQPAGCNA